MDHCPAARSNDDPVLVSLAGAARFRLEMSWYFIEFMMLGILTRFPGPLEDKQPHNITEPPPYLYTGYFLVWAFFFLCQTHLECWLPKSSILVSSDHKTRFQSKVLFHVESSVQSSVLLNSDPVTGKVTEEQLSYCHVHDASLRYILLCDVVLYHARSSH